MKSLPVLSLLKLRASYGLTGNAEIANFGSLALYSAEAAGYAGIPGQAPDQIANPDLTWEKTLQTEKLTNVQKGNLWNNICSPSKARSNTDTI